MKNVLFIDACVRKDDSRSKQISNAFLDNLSQEYKIDYLDITTGLFQPLIGDFFNTRQGLLENNALEHPRFNYAHQFANADMIVIAAPFWDLSFPAILKIYIENVSVDGITFTSTSDGLKGLCKADKLVYCTSRGGFYHDNIDEQATPYLKALCRFFGIQEFTCFDADGMDVQGFDGKNSLQETCKKAKDYAKTL